MSSRTPRPLVASPSLLRALDACGGAYVKGLRGSRKKLPTLSLVALERLEQEIGARLHDDVLVLLALRDPVAQLLTGISDVNSIADAADEHPAPEGWVCISTVYSDPVGERVAGAHGGSYLFLAAEREPHGAEARLIVGDDGLDDTVDDAEISQSLGAFIEQMIHDARSGEWGDAITAGEGRVVPLEPQPSLVRGRSLAKKSGAQGLVTHPKFGPGEVLERTGEGDQEKVVVKFADKQRTLLARFLLPHPGSDPAAAEPNENG